MLKPEPAFYIQIVLFVGLWWVLRRWWFEPALRVIRERATRSEGALAEARAVEAEAERLAREHAAALDRARHEAERDVQEILRAAEAEHRGGDRRGGADARRGARADRRGGCRGAARAARAGARDRARGGREGPRADGVTWSTGARLRRSPSCSGRPSTLGCSCSCSGARSPARCGSSSGRAPSGCATGLPRAPAPARRPRRSATGSRGTSPSFRRGSSG